MGDTLLATGEPEGRFRADRTTALPRYSVRYLHLTALWAYGVSQPVLSLVDANAEILVLHGVSRLEALILALSLMLVPPLALLGYTWLAGRFSRWAGDMLYLFVVAGLTLPSSFLLATVLELGKLATLVFVGCLGVLGVLLYARARAARFFLSASLVLPAVGLTTFALGLPALTDRAEAGHPSVSTRHPIVLVAFDELPLSSLLTSERRVDHVRYPNFARLARESTWYPNATTVHSFSTHAVPAILTGNVPSKESFPASFDHPQNLFTLLANTYSLNVFETATRLCPKAHCAHNRLGVTQRLRNLFLDVKFLYFSRVTPESMGGIKLGVRELAASIAHRTQVDYDEFLAGLDAVEGNPSLSYVHLELPHVPWRYLPSGREYAFTQTHGLGHNWVWTGDEWVVRQAQQRHLLQLGHADRQLGRLIDRLERSGLYDRVLLVVLADHGAAFSPGLPFREVTVGSIEDIAFVPLFVRYPGQRRGAVDQRHALVTDVLPTIADVIGMRLPKPVDGTSLIARRPGRDRVQVRKVDGTVVEATYERLEPRFAMAVEKKTALFGPSWESTYRIGTNVDLLGTKVQLPRVRTEAQVVIEDAAELYDVDRTASVLPVHVSGVARDGSIGDETELAVAVNGRLRALTRCSDEDGRTRFRAMLPEGALRDGRNRVDVYAIRVTASGRRLVWLGGSESTA